jgi:hypothetical protein
MSLYAKRLEKGRFIWPTPTDGVVRRDRLAEPASYLPSGACRISGDASFFRSQRPGLMILSGYGFGS